jgi:hypothetical protein
MARLKEVAELAWRQVFPNPNDETSISKEEFITTAKGEYALQLWIQAKNEKREEGFYNVPTFLLSEATLDVEDNAVDISDLDILRALPSEIWLQNIGGIRSKCEYVKSTVNQAQLLGDADDGLADNVKTYYVLGKKIYFPRGTHSTKLPIIYANSGGDVDDDIEIDDMIAGIIRTRLVEIHIGRTGMEDKTNNQNPNI